MMSEANHPRAGMLPHGRHGFAFIRYAKCIRNGQAIQAIVNFIGTFFASANIFVGYSIKFFSPMKIAGRFRLYSLSLPIK